MPMSASVSSLFYGGSIYTIATALQVAATLLVTPVLTRQLDSGRFGTLSIALIVTQAGSIAAALGIPSAITRLYFQGGEGPRAAASLVWSASALSFVTALCIHLLGPIWIGVLGVPAYTAPFQLAVWTIPPLVIARSTQTIFRARGEPLRFVLVAAFLIVVAPGIGLALTVLRGSVVAYLVGIAVGSSLGAIAGLNLVRSPLVVNPQVVRRALAIGFPTVVHGFGLLLLTAVDRIVIQHFLGSNSVGQYQAAYLAGSLGIAVLSGLNNAWAPMIHGSSEADRWDLLSVTSGEVIKFAAIVAVAIALAAPLGMAFLAPAAYQPETLAPVAAIVAWTAVPFAVYLAAVHIPFQTMKTRVLAVITPVSAGVNIGLNLLLIPRFGLQGAAYSTVIAYSSLALLMHLWSHRSHPVAYPWKAILFWAAGSFLVVSIATRLPDSTFWLVAQAILGGVAVVGVVGSHWLRFRGSRAATI